MTPSTPTQPAREPSDDDLLTLSQACAYAQVTRRTLYNWIEKGKLIRYDTAGGGPRVRRGELVRKAEGEV